MLSVKLIEDVSRKTYTLYFPTIEFKDTNPANNKSNNIRFLETLDYNLMNIYSQLDIQDDEIDVIYPNTEVISFKTPSGKGFRITRYMTGEGGQLWIKIEVEINGTYRGVFNGVPTTTRVNSQPTNSSEGGLIFLYHKETNSLYQTNSPTYFRTLSTSPMTFIVGVSKDNDLFEPYNGTYVVNTTQSRYNSLSTRPSSVNKSDVMTSWLSNLPNSDKPNITYPDPSPDPEPDPEPDPPLPGDGDTESEPIPDPPPLPTFDVTSTGFVVVYNPTVLEIQQLAYFMWSGEFVDLIKKMFGSPFECLISLKMLFSPIVTGAKQTVQLGNVETTVSMSKVTQQFVDVDMGTINITEFFGSFADYAPYTKIHIFLPFIGYKDLNVDEVMNAQLHLRYRIDVYSGACIAFITVKKAIKSTQLNSILYQFDGNCAMEIPFTSNDNSRYVSAILNAAASSALSLANTSSFSPPQIASGFQKGEKASLELGSLAPVANGMLDVLSVKPNVQRAGSLAGAVAAMGIKTPYIIIHRPIAQIPTDYQHYYGIPLNLSMQFSTLSGFTVVSQVFFQSQIATEREIDMITELLRNGVIF